MVQILKLNCDKPDNSSGASPDSLISSEAARNDVQNYQNATQVVEKNNVTFVYDQHFSLDS